MPTEKKVGRKLRAILSADVKGYSLWVADDELHTIRTLKRWQIRAAAASPAMHSIRSRAISRPAVNR